MSNLCYNCGDCHLPRPCANQLKFCEICTNLGHAYNFCPLGVRNKEPSYQFWALCHNCDNWHLPEPCLRPLRLCMQCGNHAHLEYFCPINPLSRQPAYSLNLTPKDAKSGTKRQRTNGSEGSEKGDGAGATDPLPVERVREIQNETARRVLELSRRGYDHNDILQHVERAPIQTPFGMPVIPTNPEDLVFKAATVNATPSTTAPGSLQSPFTPSSIGVYATQHQRFCNGELAQNVRSSYQAPYVPDMSLVPVASTPVPRQKRTHATSACADCKGAKKLCSHLTGAAADDASNVEPLSAAIVPTAGVKGIIELDSKPWFSSFTNTTTAPTHAGSITETSATGALIAPVNPMHGLDRAKISLLLNAGQDSEPRETSEVGTTSTNQFTYNTMGNNLPLNSNTDANNELPSMHAKADGAEMSPPVDDTVETAAFVMVPHVTEQTVPDQAEEVGQEPAQEPVQGRKIEPKPKKGRGRPKRKN